MKNKKVVTNLKIVLQKCQKFVVYLIYNLYEKSFFAYKKYSKLDFRFEMVYFRLVHLNGSRRLNFD